MMPTWKKAFLVLAVIQIVALMAACSARPAPATTPTPHPVSEEQAVSPVPTAVERAWQPATPTATPTATPAPVDLPVRAGAYPLQGAPLGAGSAQQVVELARWGKGVVSQAAAAPDGKGFALASSAGVFFFDLASMQPVESIYTSSAVAAIRYAPDGDLLAAAVNNQVLVLRSKDGASVYTLVTGGQPTAGDWPLEFSPDGKTLATLGSSSVQIWEMDSGKLAREIPVGKGATSLQYLADSSLLVYSVGQQGGLARFDAASGALRYATPAAPVYSWVLAQTGAFAAAKSDASQKDFTVYETATGTQVAKISLPGLVYQSLFSTDGSLLVINLGKQVCTWAFPGGLAGPCIQKYDYSNTALLSDGKTLLIRNQKSASLVDGTTGKVTGTVEGMSFNFFLLSSGGNLYLFEGVNTISIWDEAGQRKGRVEGFHLRQGSASLALLPAGALDTTGDVAALAVGGRYTSALLYDAETGAELPLTGKAVYQIVVSENQKMAAAVEQKAISLRDLTSKQTRPVAEIKSPGEVLALALAGDGSLLGAVLAGEGGGAVRLWDTKTGAQVAQIPLSAGTLYSSGLAISPDAKSMALIDNDPNEPVKLFDIRNLAAPQKITGLNMLAQSLAFSPDGALLAVAAGTGRVTLLESSNWSVPRQVIDTGIFLEAITFIHEGKALAIAGRDGLLHIWGSAPDGAGLAELAETPEPVATARPYPQSGTPYPVPVAKINAANAGGIVELARWGKGNTRAMAVSADHRWIAVSTSVGVTLFDAQTLQPVDTIETPFSVSGARFAPDSSKLGLLYYHNGQITVVAYSVAARRRLFERSVPRDVFQDNARFLPFDFSPDGQTLALLGIQEVYFLDAASGKETRRQPLPLGESPRALRYSGIGEALVLESLPLFKEDGGLRWFDPASGVFGASNNIPALSAVAVSPGSVYVAGVSNTGALRLLDAATGKPVGAEIDLGGAVMALEFSPDSRRMAVSFQDGRLCLWSVPDGQAERCLLEGGSGLVSTLHFDAAGQYLLAGDAARIRIWKTVDWSELLGAPTSPNEIRTFAMLPDDKLVILNKAGLARWQYLAAARLRLALPGEAVALAYAPDGKTLAGGGAWGTQTWETGAGKPLDTLKEPAVALAITGQGDLLAAARPDGTVALYRLPGGKLLYAWEEFSQPASKLAFLEGGKVLAALNAESARLWNTSDGAALPAPQGSSAGILTISDGQNYQMPGAWFGLDASLLAHFWEIQTGKAIREDPLMRNKAQNVRALSLIQSQLIALSPDSIFSFNPYGYPDWQAPFEAGQKTLLASNAAGNLVAAAGEDAVSVFNQKGELIRQFEEQAGALALTLNGDPLAFSVGSEVQVWNLAIAPDRIYQEFALSQSNDFSLSYLPEIQILVNDIPSQPAILWNYGYRFQALNPTSGRPLADIDAGVQDLAYGLDGGVEAFISNTGKIGTLIAGKDGPVIPVPPKMGASAIGLSADGRRLAATLYDGRQSRVGVWDTATAAPLLSGGSIPDGFYRAIALSPDGNRLAVVTVEGLLRIFAINPGGLTKKMAEIALQNGQCAAFSPDGQLVAVGDAQGGVTIFDLSNGLQQVATFIAHGQEVQSLLFLPAGNVLATTGKDGTIRLWGPP